MPVTSLFRGLAEERDAVFVKAGSGPEIVRKGTRAGHTYELLGSLRGPYKRVEPLLVKLDDDTEVFPLFQHPGIEILYMLSGVMEYGYGRQRYKMERGDTLAVRGRHPPRADPAGQATHPFPLHHHLRHRAVLTGAEPTTGYRSAGELLTGWIHASPCPPPSTCSL